MTQMQDKRRLLEMIEYLDSRYIEEMFDDLKIPERQTELTTAKRSKIKHLRYLIPLAACILLLSIASPLVSYVAEVISNFNAGAGSGTSESTETEEVPYLQFSPDLEPISAELAEEINEAFIVFYLDGITKDELMSKWGDEAEQKYNQIWRVIRNYDFLSPYYGTFSGCVVFETIPDGYPTGWQKVTVAGYEFNKHIYVYKNNEIYFLDQAYEIGLVNDEDIEKMFERRENFFEFKRNNPNVFEK